MLATFIALRERECVRLVASRDVAAALAKRLKMFVLRAKVTVADETETLALLGVAGASAPGAVAAAVGVAPPEHMWRAARGPGDVVALRAPGERFVLLAPIDAAQRVWDALLAAGQAPAPTTFWEGQDIVQGLPWVTAATQEQFIPQMANLELIGGVSFDKGCYPGQEIVARTHYRGEVKRRLRLAHVEAQPPPAPGDELFVGGATDQTCGMVVNAAPAPGGGCDLLAVVQNAALAAEPVRLRSGDGPKLAFRDLPYPVPGGPDPRVGLAIYVYYRVAEPGAAATQHRVEAVLADVRRATGVGGRLMRRADDPGTWMEVYEPVPDEAAFSAALAAAEAAQGIAALLAPGAKRVAERFVPCA
jgi:hypothetical protein